MTDTSRRDLPPILLDNLPVTLRQTLAPRTRIKNLNSEPVPPPSGKLTLFHRVTKQTPTKSL